jgi:integrase
MKLTKTTVEKLALPESGQVLIWDADMKGFGVRLTPGGRVYIVQGRVNGKTRRVTLGKHGLITADQARKKAIQTLAGLSDGTDPIIEKARKNALSVTLRQVADDYIKDRRDKLKPSTVKNINRHVEKNFTTWAKNPVASITRDKVAAKHTELTKRGPAQADQAFRVLRALLNYARATYRPEGSPILPENPVDVLNQNQRHLWNRVQARESRIPDGKVGHGWNLLQSLRADEAQTTISRTNADLVTLLLLTGCRWSEAAELTWDRVNLEEGWFHLPDPKNRNPVTLPLSTVARKILEERPRVNEFVFPARSSKGLGHVKDARGTFKKLSEAVEASLSAHDLRRTFTNVALKSCKMELWKVKMLTNHKMTGDVTLEHYSDKQDLRYLAPETERISAWIVEQGKIAAAGNVVSIESARRA